MTKSDSDFTELFNRLVDGVASEADEQQLFKLLRSNSEARRAYREFMSLHSALHWDFVATLAPQATQEVSPQLLVGGESGALRGSRVAWLLAFVAGTVVASVVALLLSASSVDRAAKENAATSAPRDSGSSDSQANSIAALLVDQVNAEFADGRSPDGVRIIAGQYELLKGIVHLRFAQGADVVIASPARLDVRDAQHIRLAYGNVRVTAPPAARGFTIATASADYVDLGTEFGLRVDPRSGASDLYVFDGQVNVADPRTGKVLSEVVEGESTRYVDGAASKVPEIDEDTFPTPGAIGFHRWQQYERDIQADDRLLAFFPFRRAADESELVNSHDAAGTPAGRIEGARWTTGRWPGKAALLFDRDTDFVQLNIPGEHDELTIAVWLKLDRLDFVFNAILNSDGYDLGHVHLQLTRQGHPRGGVAVPGPYNERLVGSPIPLGQWTHIASVLTRATRSHRVYVNGVLTLERTWRADQVLRPGSCRLGNWLAVEGDRVANRALRGQIDELAIWNRALSVEEIKQHVEAGRPGLLWNEE